MKVPHFSVVLVHYYPTYKKDEYNYTYGLSLDYNGSSYINKYAPAYIVTKYGDKFAYANFLWTTVQIVPDYDKLSYHGDISESSGFYFTCPKDNVILYRWHGGSENGSTKYAYAPLKLKAIYKSDYPSLYGTYTADIVPKNYSIHIDSTYWTGEMKESDTYGATKGLQVQNGWAWTGRYHYDENGATKYQVGRIVLTINGKTIYAPTNIHTTKYYDDRKESRGNWDKWFHPKDTFIISRQHKGDENETTWYTYSYYRVKV